LVRLGIVRPAYDPGVMMEVGLLQFTIRLRGCHSLKEKRHVVKSIKDKLRARFNVSIAEVDDQDLWQTGVLGLAACGNDAKRIRSLLDKIVMMLRLHPTAELVDHQIDIL
jgi:uncharacterized protein YlxP (DUF503 family)